VTITAAGWGGGPITTWGWGGWGGVVPPAPPTPGVPAANQGGSWLSQDPFWERELLSSFDGETIQRVYNALASLLVLQEQVTKAWENQLVRNQFAIAFTQWRKAAAGEARRMIAKPVAEDHTALLTLCIKTERQIQRWIAAFSAEVREFGQPPESIFSGKRKKPQVRDRKMLLKDYSTKEIAKRVAVGVVQVVAIRAAIALIKRLVVALEL
jgi:hypothetical protein